MSGDAPASVNHPSWVLASRSPRRQALLRAAGLAFETRPSGVDESQWMNGGAPRAVALQTCLAKADAVAAGCQPGSIVLAADTMVVLEGEIFTQPTDRAHAAQMLTRLAGRTHTVLTALCLTRAGGESLMDVVRADVRFNPLDEALVRDYVASGEADDKAGAYGIQGLGARFVAAVEGDLTCVIGLPLARLRELAIEMGGADPFGKRASRDITLAAFPDLTRLPAECLSGIQ